MILSLIFFVDYLGVILETCVLPDISLLFPGNTQNLHVTFLLLPVIKVAVEGRVRLFSLVLQDKVELVEVSLQDL